MDLKYIFIFLLLPSLQVKAQEVKSSGGGHYKSANTQVSYTIGEPLTNSYTNSNPKVTQGFHQTKITVTGGSIQLASNIEIQFYPNPTTQQIIIEHHEQKSDFSLKIYNQLGQLIRTETLNTTKSIIDLLSLAQGNYQFIVQDKTFKTVSQKTISILK